VELDRALVLWFPGPASFTGEDCVEFQLHGGPAVVGAVTKALLDLGMRLAEPGEFTRRAFEHGRLDLAQAEAVADLVDAETEQQRRQALGQLEGQLSQRHREWRASLIEALVLLEAAVDFPDEDLPLAATAQLRAPIAEVAADLALALADSARGQRVRDGYRVAIIGAPNAGKSSLLNALARSDAAIVTSAPGTTRDVIELALDLAGFRVWLADTAGVRDSADPVEVEGVRRAVARAEGADLRLLVVDGAAGDDDWRAAAAHARAGDICVVNKSDLGASAAGRSAVDWAAGAGLRILPLSLITGIGLGDLEAELAGRVTQALAGLQFPAATRARHGHDLQSALDHLRRALDQLDGPLQPELVAEDVRLAARSLSRITGGIDSERVLDAVFSRFCVGK
jgi:tRNA modification GTPase